MLRIFFPFFQELLLSRQNVFFFLFFFEFTPLIFTCISLLRGTAWTGPGDGGSPAVQEQEVYPVLGGLGSKKEAEGSWGRTF